MRTRSAAVQFVCRSIIDFRVLMVNKSPPPWGTPSIRQPPAWSQCVAFVLPIRKAAFEVVNGVLPYPTVDASILPTGGK